MKSTETRPKAGGKVAATRKTGASPAAEDRRQRIAAEAYYKAEARGFMPGMEMDDWLQAEAEFDRRGGI